jgi:superfamily I DNA and RNA helicase
LQFGTPAIIFVQFCVVVGRKVVSQVSINHFFSFIFSKQNMPTRQQYNKAFLAEFAQLNAAQRTAVEHIEGPVLVIAGPGTGKTHILSARIGRILMETDTQPFNILCLTFTEAGVRAMRERLLQFIGPEAYRVHIFTFHSFCNNIYGDRSCIYSFSPRRFTPFCSGCISSPWKPEYLCSCRSLILCSFGR